MLQSHSFAVHHDRQSALRRILFFGLLSLCLCGEACAVERSGRIFLSPPALAQLADAAREMDTIARWEFADITLDALLAAYRDEISASTHEQLRDPQRRAKLHRWIGGARTLEAQIQSARQRLADGATLDILVDAQYQVFLVIDGRPLAVTGIRPAQDTAIEQSVVDRFCAYNACPTFDDTDSPSATAPDVQRQSSQPIGAGSWSLSDRASPSFDVGTIRCRFATLSNRQQKSAFCQQLAQEVASLLDALGRASKLGVYLDWTYLQANPPRQGDQGQLVVNSDGRYLLLPTAGLSQLAAANWEALVEWSRRYLAGESERLPLEFIDPS